MKDMRRKMAIDNKIRLVDRSALLRKSWQKSLSSSMRTGRSEITERESERDGERESEREKKREEGRVSLRSHCMMLLNRAK